MDLGDRRCARTLVGDYHRCPIPDQRLQRVAGHVVGARVSRGHLGAEVCVYGASTGDTRAKPTVGILPGE